MDTTMIMNVCIQALVLAAAILHISPAAIIPRNAPSTTPGPSPDGSLSALESTPSPATLPVQYNPDNPSTDEQTETATQSTPYTTTEHFGECEEPDMDDLHRQLRRQNGRQPEIALLKKDKNMAGSRFFPTPESLVHESHYTNSTCPTELLGVTGNLNARSICPWTFKEDINPMRYPPTIMVAECRCPSCIDPSAAETGFLEDGESTCKPVTFKLKVLHRRECVMGIYLYESVYEEIPVACSCVRNITEMKIV